MADLTSVRFTQQMIRLVREDTASGRSGRPDPRNVSSSETERVSRPKIFHFLGDLFHYLLIRHEAEGIA